MQSFKYADTKRVSEWFAYFNYHFLSDRKLDCDSVCYTEPNPFTVAKFIVYNEQITEWH